MIVWPIAQIQNRTLLQTKKQQVVKRAPPPLPPSSTSTSASASSSRFENEFLPSPAVDEEEGAALLESLDFHEILDEDALKHKFTVVNRAPVMMAWASVVAERLGF